MAGGPVCYARPKTRDCQPLWQSDAEVFAHWRDNAVNVPVSWSTPLRTTVRRFSLPLVLEYP